MKATYRLVPLARTISTPRCLTRSPNSYHGNWAHRQQRCYRGVKGSSSEGSYVIDLRSDTLTKPSEGMKAAMVNTTWGDDVFGEDPTVKELQRKMADMFGMEAALFVPSGTMGNLIAVMAHCYTRGLEVLLGDKSHLIHWEQGGMATLGGVHSRTMPNLSDGTFNLDCLDDYIRPKDDPHQPWTALIGVENTHNYCGGSVLPQAFLKQLRDQAKRYEIPVHMDGARVMNAAVALDVEVSDITQYVDSISFCFSKGVGTPVGSVIGGSAELIARALRLRKVCGGGMRQPGPLVAACLHSLSDVRQRMKLDHQHAEMLREAILTHGGDVFTTDNQSLLTNLIYIEMLKPGLSAEQFCARLQQITESEQSAIGDRIVVKGMAFSRTQARICLYTGVSSEDVEKTIAKIKFIGEEMA